MKNKAEIASRISGREGGGFDFDKLLFKKLFWKSWELKGLQSFGKKSVVDIVMVIEWRYSREVSWVVYIDMIV